MSEDQIALLLGRIDGKLDSLSETFKAHVLEDAERARDVNTVLQAHSEAINKAKGATSLAMGVASVLGAAITLVVEKLFLKG